MDSLQAVLYENAALQALLSCGATNKKMPSVVALVGAGGKTNTMTWIARTLAKHGKRSIISTSTKVFPFEEYPSVYRIDYPNNSDYLAALEKAFQSSSIVFCAHAYVPTRTKATGLSAEDMTLLHESGICDMLLVEADGAARKPLKAPAFYEPCLSKEVDLCIALMGVDALGFPLSDGIVHRASIFMELTGCEAGEYIALSHFVRLAKHAYGAFKDCPPSCARAVVWNKAEKYCGGLTSFVADCAPALRDNPPDAGLHIFAGNIQKEELVQLS